MPHEAKAIHAVIWFSSITITEPRRLKMSLTLLICSSLAPMEQMKVMLLRTAMAVLGITRNTAGGVQSERSSSCDKVIPAATDTSICFSH